MLYRLLDLESVCLLSLSTPGTIRKTLEACGLVRAREAALCLTKSRVSCSRTASIAATRMTVAGIVPLTSVPGHLLADRFQLECLSPDTADFIALTQILESSIGSSYGLVLRVSTPKIDTRLSLIAV
jgi:hypothetical protein